MWIGFMQPKVGPIGRIFEIVMNLSGPWKTKNVFRQLGDSQLLIEYSAAWNVLVHCFLVLIMFEAVVEFSWI